MKYHVGLLDDDPRQNRIYQYVTRGRWNRGMPDDVRHELAVWLAMPGFEYMFHKRNLRISTKAFHEQRILLPGYDEVRDDVAVNWLSASREDCVKICRLRPGIASGLPLLSQLSIMDDLKKGLTQAQIARDYGVSTVTIHFVAKKGVQRGSKGWNLPNGFEMLVM